MMENSKKTIIVANWKMNFTLSDSIKFLTGFSKEIGKLHPNAEVIFAPSFISLYPVLTALSETNYKVAAQNMHWELEGNFTGETSPTSLKELEVSHVILGHSERRHLFNETDEEIAKKLETALYQGLKPILCIGETDKQRETQETFDVLKNQLDICLKGKAHHQLNEVIIAYEPVWAIGTGKTATPDQAQEVHFWIRDHLKKMFDPAIAARLPILYGGSVKPENAKALLAQTDINGLLVGGASLDPIGFKQIVESA